MRGLFNSVCYRCSKLKPRCATTIGNATGFERPLCPDCRKEMKGTFRLHEKHRSAKR